jgi:hypothetical protein
MTLEEIEYIYGTLNIGRIQSKVYLKNNHVLFMKKFGILIQGIEMTRLGKVPTIAIGFLSISR